MPLCKYLHCSEKLVLELLHTDRNVETSPCSMSPHAWSNMEMCQLPQQRAVEKKRIYHDALIITYFSAILL